MVRLHLYIFVAIQVTIETMKNVTAPATPLTATRLRAILNYDHKTGVFTRSIQTAPCNYVGSEAGCLMNTGYICISVDGKPYLAHRLAWLWTYGVWPPKNIDHKDHDRANNRIGNLRLCNQSQNRANSSSKSGYKGVSWFPSRNKWRARITVQYKEHLIGYFDSQSDAKAAYQKRAVELFGEFAN
jgi:HNH endonuclease/AP2 domain